MFDPENIYTTPLPDPSEVFGSPSKDRRVKAQLLVSFAEDWEKSAMQAREIFKNIEHRPLTLLPDEIRALISLDRYEDEIMDALLTIRFSEMDLFKQRVSFSQILTAFEERDSRFINDRLEPFISTLSAMLKFGRAVISSPETEDGAST